MIRIEELFSQYFEGGLRHASASIGGSEAYKHMKFEGGVHRVQRVPKTEKQGRIHTSTMTVAILPLPTEVRHHSAPSWNRGPSTVLCPRGILT